MTLLVGGISVGEYYSLPLVRDGQVIQSGSGAHEVLEVGLTDSSHQFVLDCSLGELLYYLTNWDAIEKHSTNLGMVVVSRVEECVIIAAKV